MKATSHGRPSRLKPSCRSADNDDAPVVPDPRTASPFGDTATRFEKVNDPSALRTNSKRKLSQGTVE